jgi:hypothetical protein
VTYHRIDNGPQGRPNPPVESLPLQWPVLARLPWVESGMEPIQEQCAVASNSYATARGQAEAEPRPALRLATLPAQAPPFPPASRGNDTEQDGPAHTASHTSIPQPKRQYRIDAGEGRIVAAAIGRSGFPTAPHHSNSFASRLFQWHTALAPHAGVALSFFLALTAGLLYWRTLGPMPAPMPLEAAAAPLAWSAEYSPPDAAESAAPPVNYWQASTPAYDVPDMAWPLSPRVTLDAAPLSAAVIPSPSLESVDSLAHDLSAEVTATEDAAKQQPAAEVEITPTPTAPSATSAIGYPSTPYALIDPNAVRPDDAGDLSPDSSPATPTEAPIEGASLPGSPR